MRFLDVFAASLVAPLVAAHGGIPGAPKIWGLGPRDIRNLKSRDILGGHAARVKQGPQQMHKRQGGDSQGRCGPVAGGASCAEGYCCSGSGWCGPAGDSTYCAAPDGLFQYGPANDANVVPVGGTTRSIARPKLGSITYGGAGVYACTEPGKVAITYDDGPYLYTGDVLDSFNAATFKATFFITGRNIGKGSIDDKTTNWPGYIQRMYDEGHQIASHTWSHQDLSLITQEQRYEQMVKNEMAIANIIGKFPTYMRPPYSSCTAESGCEQDMAELGYVVSYFDLDTSDYLNLSPDLIQTSKDKFNTAIEAGSPTTDEFLAIAHDIHEITAHNLTVAMIAELQAKGYTGVTMGECLGDPEANWYRDASSGRVATVSSFTPPATLHRYHRRYLW
ncbi:Nn.00g073730.m01.CDS01 [Neocucurbitaria sp. VM-36]